MDTTHKESGVLMLGIDFCKYDEPVSIDIEICKKNYNRTKLAYVNCYEKNIIYRFGDTDEINFKVPKFIRIKNRKVRNPSYQYLSGDMILKVTMLDNVQYFIVTKCVEIDDDNGIRKEVQGYSYEYVLTNKRISGYEGVKKLYDITAPEESILHEIMRLNPSWSINYVNPDVNKFRDIKVDDESCLGFLYGLQETLECVFQFDTVNRTISVEKLENIGTNKGLVLNSRNYLKNINIEPDFNDVVTRLYVYGKDNLGINAYTVNGQSYIDCFDYYMANSSYVDDDLKMALEKYNQKVEEKDGLFNEYLTTIKEKTVELANLNNELADLQSKLKIIQDNIDLAINTSTTTETDLDNLKTQEDAAQEKVNVKENEVGLKQSEIDSVRELQVALRNELSMENNFSHDQIMSLNEITKEGVLQDNTISEDEELYKLALEKVEKMAQPTITFSTDVVNFMNSLEHQINWEKVLLGLGDIVNIEDENLDMEFKVRLTQIEYHENGIDLNLSFSNKDSINDPALFFAEMSDKVNKSFTNINMNKFKYGSYNNDKNEILDYINGELDLTRQQAVAGHNNDIIINERGITTTNAQNPLMQTKIMNNLIAFTEDGWRTCKTAIKNGKIIADNIIGKLIIGSEMIIGNAEGTLNILGNKIVIRDKQSNEKVILGEYTSNKFGLKLFNSKGDVILDEDGILQTWQEGRCDNVDSGYPLKLWVYIPEQTKSIKSAKLRFHLDYLRGYSTTVSSASAFTSESGLSGSYTSSSGGYVSDTTSSNKISSVTTKNYNFENVDGQTNGHNHGLNNGDRIAIVDGSNKIIRGEYFYSSGNHHHIFDIPSHGHSFSVSSHSHSLPDLSHNHRIPSHAHNTSFGIYEGSTKASGVRVVVNGSYVGGTYSSDQYNIDLAGKLTVGGWNEIQLSSTAKGRIDATVFVQAMMGT